MVNVGRSLSENGTINVPNSINAPSIDGKWTTLNEWNGASENTISDDNNSTMILRIEQNGTDLFILIDFISDKINSSSDNAWVYFDTKDDGATVPQTDDYSFDTTGFRQGNASGYPESQWQSITMPEGAKMEKGFSHLNDPYENTTGHEIYEFEVPFSFLGAASSYGFFAAAIDSSNYIILHWPIASADPSDPIVWGDIQFSTQFSPEISTAGVVAFVLSATLVTLAIHRRKEKFLLPKTRSFQTQNM